MLEMWRKTRISESIGGIILKVVYECFECGADVPMGYDESVTGIPEADHVGKVVDGVCLNCKSNKIWIKQGE